MTRGIATNLLGLKFGHLTVVERAESDKQANAQWLCDCECGSKVIVRASFLKKGQIVCSRTCKFNPAKQIKDISNKKFGTLTAIKNVGMNKQGKAVWLFRCECGNEVSVPSDRVLNSGMKSCGKGIHKATYKHGLSNTRGYKAMHYYKYITSKTNQTPAWLTKEDVDAMTVIYVNAHNITKETGIKHEVDHIYPLQGKKVSGLHVPSNLRIITRSENRKKSNHLDDVC